VVATIVPTISDDAILRPEPPAGPTYTAYLRARSLSIAPDGHDAALASARALEQLIANDPGFIPAYAPLARLLNTDYFYSRLGSTGAADRARAQALCDVAYAADTKDAHINSLMGWCALRRQAWDEAERHFREVVWLNPLHCTRLNEAGDGLVYLGEIDSGEQLIEAARALRGNFDAAYWNDIGKVRLFRGDLDGACKAFEAGGTSLIWTPVYAAIASALAGHDPRPMRARALNRLQPCWPEGVPVTAERLLAYFDFHHPFRLKEPQQLMERGLRMAFAEGLA
jgi:tetratricopeptide (TPR) repeat protein